MSVSQIQTIQGILGVTQDGSWGPVSQAALDSATQGQIESIQQVLGIISDGNWGPESQAAFAAIMGSGSGWPFAMHADGPDLVSDPDIVITCFGGNGDGTNSDPQDNGDTASGKNTNSHPWQGVSVAMDGRSFPHLSPAEHKALDGAPIPKVPWGTQVVVTIGSVTIQPQDGIIDLGPGLQASKPGKPHALDLTVASAKLVDPGHSNSYYANDFEVRGQFRIIGVLAT